MIAVHTAYAGMKGLPGAWDSTFLVACNRLENNMKFWKGCRNKELIARCP